MKLKQLKEILEQEFPPETAWERDRIGLQIDSGKDVVNKIFMCLEVNEEAIKEAINANAEIIIAFHPLIFHPLGEIDRSDRVGKLVTELIKNDISLYVIHTNLDAHPYGTNYVLTKRLGLEKYSTLERDENYPERGMGIVSILDEPIELTDLVEKVSHVCNAPVRYNVGKSDTVKNIGVLCGSGSNYIDAALEKDLDVLITSDITYHVFHSVNGKLALIDPGHYEMEQFVADAMENILRKRIGGEVELVKNSIRTNPVKYFPTENFEKNQIKYLNNKKGNVENGRDKVTSTSGTGSD